MLLDGYPATKNHADFLSEVVSKKGLTKPLILLLDVPDEVVRQRLKDQDPQQVEQDLKDYHREMDFIAVYFPQADIAKVDGDQRPDAVFGEIQQTLDQRLKK